MGIGTGSGADFGEDVRRRLLDGDLTSAVERAKENVRRDPASAGPRILLFQLFAVLGDWGRARAQLDLVASLDADASAMVATYRALLSCEARRAEIFAGREAPTVLGHPDPWIARLLEALRQDRAGESAAAAAQRAAALEEAPAVAGTLDGESFAWIADGDQRLGPVLEAVVNGRWCWIPMPHVRSVAVEEPADLRDLVWTPVTVTLVNGGAVAAFLPTRYPGTVETGQAPFLLARRTEWVEGPGGLLFGLGQRMFVTDGGEHALMDVRSILFDRGGEDAAHG